MKKITRRGKLNWWNVIVVVALLIIPMLRTSAFAPEWFMQNEKPRIVFLISEDPNNYEAHKTIPEFADFLHREHGFNVNVLLGEGDRGAFRFPGLEIISQADLLVVFSRRIALSPEQLTLIKNYLKQGKPLIGLRTANHAFSPQDEIMKGHEAWLDFVPDILGCQNRGYGPVELGTDVSIVPEAKDHPILAGFAPSPWHSKGNLYLVAPLLDKEATVLLTGKAAERIEPVAWTRRTADNSRVFYTSLAHPTDFEVTQIRNLLVNGIYWALNRAR